MAGPFGWAFRCFIEKTRASSVRGSAIPACCSLLWPLLLLFNCYPALPVHTSSHMFTHTPLHMRTFTHTDLKLHVQLFSHRTHPWPLGYFLFSFFHAALSFHRVKPLMSCVAHSFLLQGNGCVRCCVQAEVTAQRSLEPGCFVHSPAACHCWESQSQPTGPPYSEDLPIVRNTEMHSENYFM